MREPQEKIYFNLVLFACGANYILIGQLYLGPSS